MKFWTRMARVFCVVFLVLLLLLWLTTPHMASDRDAIGAANNAPAQAPGGGPAALSQDPLPAPKF